MRLPFSFLQGGVSPFRTLLNTARPEIPPPIKSPSTGFSPEPRTEPATGATPVFTEDWSSGTPSGNFTFTSASTRTYIDSTGTRQTAAINTPRMQCRWNGTTWQQIGVLTEPGYTNLVLNSDNLTAATFSKNQVTATTSGTLGADNSTAMVQIVGNGVNTTHNVFRGTGSSGISSGQSFYCGWDIKKGTYNFISCIANASGLTGGWVGCVVNLTTGAVISDIQHGTAGTFDVQPVITVLRNGIYRVEFVAHFTGTLTTINTPIGFVPGASGNAYNSNNGDVGCLIQATDTVLVGGCMHAISTELCQHIVTAGSTVSTSADILKLTTGFGTLSTGGYGVVIEAEASYGQTDDEYLEGRGGGGGSDVCDLYLTSPTQWENYTTGTVDNTTNPQLPGGTPFRWAVSYDTGRAAMSINEQVVQSGVPPTLFAPDTFYLGSVEGTSSFTPTIFHSIAIYNQALDDGQLVYLSSVGGPYTITGSGVSAALAATEAPDVAAFAADIGDNAALAATEALDVAAFVVTLTDNAALAATEAQDVAAFVVTETDTAVLAVTEAQDVAAFVVTPKINAALAVTEAQDVAAFVIGNSAVLAATEAQDTAAFVVTETDTAVLAVTEAQDVAAFAITIPDNAALAATEAQDVSAFVVTLTDQAALAATEAQDVAAFVVTETDTAVLTATEAQDVAAFVASPKINAALAATEAQDTAAIVATVGDNAALNATEAQDVALINASGSDVAVLAATEAQDAAAFVATLTDNVALAATEARDVAAFAVTETDNAALAATEAPDVAAFVAIETDTAALAASEAPDIAAILADVSDVITFAVTEAPDTAAIVINNPAPLLAALAATELPDIAAIVASMGEISHIDPGLPTNRFIWPRQPERWLM